MISRGVIEDHSGLSDSEIFTSEAYSKVLASCSFSQISAVKINPVVFGDLEPSSLLTALGNDNQVLTQLTALYEEMRGGYAIADATVSLQSISP